MCTKFERTLMCFQIIAYTRKFVQPQWCDRAESSAVNPLDFDMGDINTYETETCLYVGTCSTHCLSRNSQQAWHAWTQYSRSIVYAR